MVSKSDIHGLQLPCQWGLSLPMRVSCPPWHICFWNSSHDMKEVLGNLVQHRCESQWEVLLSNVFNILKTRAESNDSVNSNHNAKLSKIFVCLKNDYSFISTFFEQLFFTWLCIHAFYLPPNIFTIHGAHHLSLSLKKLAISKTAWN